MRKSGAVTAKVPYGKTLRDSEAGSIAHGTRLAKGRVHHELPQCCAITQRGFCARRLHPGRPAVLSDIRVAQNHSPSAQYRTVVVCLWWTVGKKPSSSSTVREQHGRNRLLRRVVIGRPCCWFRCFRPRAISVGNRPHCQDIRAGPRRAKCESIENLSTSSEGLLQRHSTAPHHGQRG